MELSRISDIDRMAKDAMALFDWSVIPLGHPLRIHAYSYHHWGIVITPDNIEELRAASKRAYVEEWAPTDESVNELIAIASERAGLSDTNLLMNQKIGEYSAEHVKSLEEDARIIEVGTGAGGTILSVLHSLHAAGLDLSKMAFTLLEPSEKRLDFTLERIDEFGKSRGTCVLAMGVVGTVDELATVKSGHAHLVIQNAAIHHESFNDHLLEIKRVLRQGMPFISGDWHEGSYESPARIYWVYAMLQNPFNEKASDEVQRFVLGRGVYPKREERAELKEFREMFGLTEQRLAQAFDGYTQSEREANVGGMRYWLEVAKILIEKGKRSPEVLIQAHERVTPRITALKNAGFVFGPEDKKKYVEVIKGKGFGELGAVMVCRKPLRR